jgi:hypothetical protein
MPVKRSIVIAATRSLVRDVVGKTRFLDPDAIAFAAVSGATDIVALSNFVKGVKALNLWSALICWPMRSAQNRGSGTVVYSLGGLETTNAAMVGSPVWGANGITTGAAAYVTSVYSRTITAANLSMFAGYTGLTPGLSQVYCGFSNTSLSAPLTWNGSNGGGALNMRSFTRNNANVGFIYPASISVNGGTLSNDNALAVPSSGIVLQTRGWLGTEGAISLNNFTCGGGLRTTFGSAAIANYSIYGYFLAQLTQPQATSFYSLYTSTLGQGLGMP